LASIADKLLISMVFGDPDHSEEKVAFDGAKMTTSYLKPGIRTLLGNLLVKNEVVLKEGILGGTLSSAWPFLNLAARNPKLQYEGLKKVAGRQLHQVRYRSQVDSQMGIALFFEPETFRHVRTQCSRLAPAQLFLQNEYGSVARAPYSNEMKVRITIVESFSEFGVEGGLTLPHLYKLEFEIVGAIGGPNSSFTYEWTVWLDQFTFGKPVDAREFDLTAN
jgi:hypothetical protein